MVDQSDIDDYKQQVADAEKNKEALRIAGGMKSVGAEKNKEALRVINDLLKLTRSEQIQVDLVKFLERLKKILED